MTRVKRAYEPAAPDDGSRFLVERLWPRGIRKADLPLTAWLKDVAPSAPLRRWFHEDPEHRWPEFTRRYRRELDRNRSALQPLLEAATRGPVTLVYGARDTEHNSAKLLAEYLARVLGSSPRSRAGRSRTARGKSGAD